MQINSLWVVALSAKWSNDGASFLSVSVATFNENAVLGNMSQHLSPRGFLYASNVFSTRARSSIHFVASLENFGCLKKII